MISSSWHRALIAILLTVALAGCAPWIIPRADDATRSSLPRVCGESPGWTAKEFIENLSLRFFHLLKKLIPDGVSIPTIFGGMTVIHNLIDHPEIQKARAEDSQIGDILELVSVEPESPGVMLAVIERTITVTPPATSAEQEREGTYHRTFRVFYDPATNCIIRVISIDTEWKQVR